MQDLIGAGLTIAVGLGAMAARPLGLWLEELSYDLPYRLRPHLTISDAVVVSTDVTPGSTLGKDREVSQDRELHANLLNQLMVRGARVVVFTTVFSEPSATTSTDRLFAQALRRARGRVVLSASSTGRLTNQTVQRPIPELAAEAPWGFLSAPTGTDGVVRQLDTTTDHPTVALRAAQLLGKPLPPSTASRWLNYYGPGPDLPEVSSEQVMRPGELPAFFKGKIVLVGDGSAATNLLPTPYTRWTNHRATRNGLEATALLNLSRREWLSRAPSPIETGVMIATGALFGFAFMGMRRSAALLLAVGAMALVVAVACLLVAYLHAWFPWLIVAGLQIPVALGWAWLCETADRPRIPRPSRQPFPANSAFGPPPGPQTASTIPAAARIPPAAEAPSIPDHHLIRCIGRGAYGEVWLARDVIGRHHAVKIVKARSFPNPAPYEREFKGIERFAPISRTHPGLVQVLHIGRHDAAGYFFYIMELADDASGATSLAPERYVPKTLASELAHRGHFAVQEAVQIGRALSAALQHLHERRLVHRDIKPSNIIFVEGAPKFADIGLVAELGAAAGEMTRLGTEGYLAPEGPGAPTADVYGLGKVLYEISMGRDRWQFPEFPTTLGTRPDQDGLRCLHEIILTACETDPAHRYQSAAEMHGALEQLRGSLQ